MDNILTPNILNDLLENDDLIIIINNEVELLDFMVDMKDIFYKSDKLEMDRLITRLVLKNHLYVDETIHHQVYLKILNQLFDKKEIVD